MIKLTRMMQILTKINIWISIIQTRDMVYSTQNWYDQVFNVTSDKNMQQLSQEQNKIYSSNWPISFAQETTCWQIGSHVVVSLWTKTRHAKLWIKQISKQKQCCVLFSDKAKVAAIIVQNTILEHFLFLCIFT